jgi:tetratricopeptide (TPR) repeat protein
MLAAEEGRMEEALDNLREAHGLIPRDGVLADDFFPALREAGLVKLHDELFEKSAELLRENVRFFSKDHNAKNTFGWLASRANRCLDEAEAYLKMSLEVRPLSEAYLDTMAEIYFAKGDRKKAVEWSDRATNRDSSDSQLRQQNRRFRNDPFPLK